jgi:hypothetical protein
VSFQDRSDAELLELAQAGAAAAFAVLLHRHGPAVRSAVRYEDDPTAAVTATFVRAMRALPDLDPAAPARPWLVGLTGTEVVPDPIVPLSEEERDAIWTELARRWPTGRAPRGEHRGIRRLALVAALVAAGGLVPAAVLLASRPPPPADELRAFPVHLETRATPDPDDEPEPLPTFTFPAVPELEQPDPEPEPVVEVTPAPEPEPTPEPTTSPTANPPPSPTATASPSPSPSPAPPPPPPSPSPEPPPVEEDEGSSDPPDGGDEDLPVEPPDTEGAAG